MNKRIAALLLALAVLMSGLFSLAEDEFFDDDAEFTFFDDEELEDQTREGFEQQKLSIGAKSGYSNENYQEDQNFKYEISDDEQYCQTVRYNLLDEPDIVYMPDTLGGYHVEAIGDHTFERCMLSGVMIPAGVSELGEQAFFQCTNLKEIIVPEGVEVLRKCCFGACTQLTTVTLPSTLQEVGEMAFLGCASLECIEFPEGLKSIGANAFNTCPNLSRVVLPSAEVEVDPTAFVNCPSVQIEYAH